VMSEKTPTWDDIPSIEGLEVDWSYKTNSLLERRTAMRLLRKDLQLLLGKGHVAVKLVTSDGEYKASLMDISRIGVAVYVDENMPVELPIRLGLILGTQKIITKALVRNSNKYEGGYRIGVEFADLDMEAEAYIGELIASNVYAQP